MSILQTSVDQAATVGTEHTIYDSSAIGTYQFGADLNPMLAGDTVELRVYEMAKAGGTRRLLYFDSWTGAQDGSTNDLGPIKNFVPANTGLTDSGALRFTLKQTAGTSRTFTCSIKKFS